MIGSDASDQESSGSPFEDGKEDQDAGEKAGGQSSKSNGKLKRNMTLKTPFKEEADKLLLQ